VDGLRSSEEKQKYEKNEEKRQSGNGNNLNSAASGENFKHFRASSTTYFEAEVECFCKFTAFLVEVDSFLKLTFSFIFFCPFSSSFSNFGMYLNYSMRIYILFLNILC